jgi:tetratricopeptide (TPR) repeat protein
VIVADALLVAWYRELPQPRPSDDPDLWAAAWKEAVQAFRARVRQRYGGGTLQRLLDSADAEVRLAAVTALGMIGGMEANAPLAARLHDANPLVARKAADALWELWFRGATESQSRALHQIVHLPDFQQALAALDDLIREAPLFAEAYNQRAILFFRRGEYLRSVHDCETTLRLNPCHFGAQYGLAECYVKLGKPRAALRAFRLALEINPMMTGAADMIRALEEQVRESGSPGDRHEG